MEGIKSLRDFKLYYEDLEEYPSLIRAVKKRLNQLMASKKGDKR